MAANLYVSIGADYSQLLTDLNQATSKTMNFFKQASKDTVLRLHAKLDSDALNTVYSQLTDQLKKFNVSSSNNIFSVFDDSTKQNMLKFLDFSKPAQSMQEVIERANKLNRVLIDLNSGIGYIDSNSKDAIDTYLAGLNQIIAASKTYEQVARKSFLNTFAANKKGIIASYGDDEASLKRKRALWEQLRNEFIKHETQTGISQSKNIASIESEIDATKRLLDAKTGLNKFNKEYKNLVNQLYGAKQNGDIEKQVQLYRQLRNINLKYYGDTKDTRFRDNAQIYQQQLDALQQKTNLQKQDEANNKKILELEKQRDEINRRLGMIPANSKKKQDLLEQIQLYRNLASVEQKLYNRTYDIQHRNNADAFRAQARALAELNKQYVSSETIQRKLAGIKNLQGGIVANTMDPAQLDTNRRLLQRIISLQNDLQQAGRPQNIKQSMADLEMYKQKLREIRRENLGTNTSFMRQGGILQSLVSYARMYLSIWQGIRLVKSIAETTGEFEKQKAALKSIIQDGAIAVELFNKLKQYSLQTPLTFQELVSTTKKLTAYQIPVEDLFETTKRLSDLSSGLGVDINRIVLAYGQIRAASVLRGQEVRQLTEAGIPIINELANAFSNLEGRAVSTAEVFKKISERGVSFKMVKDILFDMTSEGGKFYNMQEKLMQTDIYSPMQKMKDLWKQTLDEIGRSSKDGILKKGLDAILTTIKNWRVVLGSVAGLIAGKLTAGVINLVKWVMTLNRAMVIANLSNIITAAATAIGLLIGKMINARAQMNKFGKEMEEINNEYIKKTDDLVKSFDKLIDKLNASAKGSQDEADAIRKLQSAYSEYLPQQDLTIERLRNQTQGYKDLTAAIADNIEAQRRLSLQDANRNSYVSNLNRVVDETLGKKFLGYNEASFKNWLESYVQNNEKTSFSNYSDVEKALKNVFFYTSDDIIKIQDKIYKLVDSAFGFKAMYEQQDRLINAYSIINRYGGNLSREKALRAYTLQQDLEKELISNNNVEGKKGKSVEYLNNASYLKYAVDYLENLGISINKNEVEELTSALEKGEKNGEDIVSYIRRAIYANGLNDKKGNTIQFNNLNATEQNMAEELERKLSERFKALSSVGKEINRYIDEFQSTDNEKYQFLNSFRFTENDTLESYQEKIKKAYNDTKSLIDDKEITEEQKLKNEELNKQINYLNKLLSIQKKIARIANVNVDKKDDKKNASQSTQNNIVRLKKEFDNLKNAYTSEQNMMKYVTESAAIETLEGLNKHGLSEYFKTTLSNGSIDWVSQFNKIYEELKKIDQDAAISMLEEWNKFIAKDVVADKLRELKNGIKDIDMAFAKSKNAKEYFQAFLDAGMSWKDAVNAAEKISGIFDISKKGSTLIQEQIGKLMYGIGIDYNLTSDDGISAFEQELRRVTEMKIGQDSNEYVSGDAIPKEKAAEILNLLSQLREIQKNELVELVKINTDNYDIKGVSSERARLYSSFLESLKSGSSAMILDSYGKLSANNARLFNPFNTGNDASFALSKLYELIKKGENVQENTSAFNKIAETLPGGNRVKEALATKNEKIIEDAIKKATSKLKLQEIAGKMDDMLSVFNSAVGLVDSFTLITGGQVNENDQFHTAMSSFTNIMSSGSSAVKKALTGDFLGAIADGAKAMSELVLFGAKIHDAGLQQEIDKLTEHIEKLDTAISNLERSASLSYGEEKWLYESNALRKMYVQLEDAKKASELENSKKIVDKDKRAELEQNVTDIEFSIEEKWKEITDDIFGSVDDIASRLGNALRDAFENGKNAARAWKDAVNEYVKDIFYNLMIESVMKDKIDEIVQGWKSKSKTDTDTKNEEKRAELIQEEYQKYIDKVDKYSKEHEGNNQMIHGYAMEQYKEYQDKVDEINATSYYSEKDAFKEWILKNTDKMAEDLNDIYNDPELQAYYKVWKNLKGQSTSSASSNSLQSMTEDTANRLNALWNTCLVEFIKGNGMLSNVESNTAGILNQIQITNQLIGSMSNIMNENQTNILGALSMSASGAKPLYVKMS